MWGVMFNMLRYIEGMYSPCSVVVCEKHFFASIEPRKLSEVCAKIVKKYIHI